MRADHQTSATGCSGMRLRETQRLVRAQETSDGAGVRLKRSIGTVALDHLDPFLLFDEFKSDRGDDYIAGFPDHPHRGFETVTYMLAGRMEHRDHAGNHGDLIAGSIQWMTAGRGIIHSEMPKQEEGLMWGFQLWVNLPAKDKMTHPRYQDIPPESVPEVATEGGTVRVLTGTVRDVRGPVQGIVTEPLYLDVRVREGGSFTQEVPAGHNAFVYVVEGDGRIGVTGNSPGMEAETSMLGVLGDGDAIRIDGGGAGIRFLLLAARPIGEPVARHGPFVMNTEEELRQAFLELRNGTFLDG